MNTPIANTDGTLNPSNWLGASFEDGSGITFGGASGGSINPVPSLPPIGGTQSVASSGGAPASGGTIGPSIAAPIAPSNPTKIGTVTPSNVGPATGSISDYFLRAIIVILGFIFVAVGLNMFRPGIVPDPRQFAPKVKA